MINSNNENLIGRVENWKFEQAIKYLEGESDEVKEIINALATSFGNVGWFDGNLGRIVEFAVKCLLPDDSETKEP